MGVVRMGVGCTWGLCAWGVVRMGGARMGSAVCEVGVAWGAFNRGCMCMGLR